MSVLVRDFDLCGSVIRPHDAYAISSVDADAALAGSVSLQFPQSIAGRPFEVDYGVRLVQVVQLATSEVPQYGWTSRERPIRL